MIELQEGAYPTFKVDHKDLPFTAADVGQTFEFSGKVKLDALTAEGPTFTFEVLEVEFPEKEQGTVKSRKAQRNIKAGGVIVNINPLGGV